MIKNPNKNHGYDEQDKVIFILIGPFVILIVGSCARPVTLVTGTWTNDEIDKSYDHVLVATLTSNVSFISTFGAALAGQLQDIGIKASKSIDLLPPKFINDENQKQEIMDHIQADGIDGNLTVSLLAKTTQTRYVPGSYHYEPVLYIASTAVSGPIMITGMWSFMNQEDGEKIARFEEYHAGLTGMAIGDQWSNERKKSFQK